MEPKIIEDLTKEQLAKFTPEVAMKRFKRKLMDDETDMLLDDLEDELENMELWKGWIIKNAGLVRNESL